MSLLNSKYHFRLSYTTSKNVWKAFLTLFTGLVFTLLATYYANRQVEAQGKKEFASVCNEIKLKITTSLHAYALLLRTGSALFAAEDTISREDWKEFNEHSGIEKNLPGIEGLGYSIIIPKSQLDYHIQKIRKEGFPQYAIKPIGDREVYTSIIFLEPFTNRNLRAFGYDMFSEPTRRKAMEISRDSDVAMLSGKVVLVQESKENIQPGVLMYIPVYRNYLPFNTVEQRRAAIKGWIYSPFRMNDLMHGILGSWDQSKQGRIHLQIYDEHIETSSLLYDSQLNNEADKKSSSDITLAVPVEFNGKRWKLLFSQSGLPFSYFQNKQTLILVSGILISILMFLLTYSLLNTRFRAQQIAEQLTIVLKEKEERLREVLENSLDASYKRNLQTGKYEYLSVVFFKMLGYTPDEMESLSLETVLGLMHHNDVAQVDNKMTSTINNETCKTDYVEYRFRHKDGHYRWLHDQFTVVRDNNGQPLALIGSVSDITERKQIEDSLKNERLLLRTVIDNIPDSIYCMDLNCRKTLANPTDVYYMGATSEEEVLGKDDFDFYPKELAETFFALDLSVIKEGKPFLNCEEKMTDEKGAPRWLLSSKIPMRNKDGDITGLLGIGRDITDRKLAEEEIKFKNEELQKVNTEKDRFFSIISHDLRSPFNGFLGLTQILAEELPSLDIVEIQNIAVSLKKSATNLFRLLENLLDWSRIQQGLIPFNPKIIGLRLVMDESLMMILDSIRNKDITVFLEVTNELKVFADQNMLETVFRNIISNAVKFTTRGGNIKLSATLIDDKYVEITITDSGIGMSKSIIEGLFSLEINTSRKGTEGETSTGLGLIICKDFIEKQGGKLWIESIEGKGSTFNFTIPGG